LVFIGTLTHGQLNIVEWFLRRIDRHGIAVAHASIRILITTGAFLWILFTKNLWTLKMALLKRVYILSILICTTGIFTTPFMVFRLKYYLAHKEEGLSTTLLGYRISEASLDIFFVCLPSIMRPVFRRLQKKQSGSIPSISTKTPPTNSGCNGMMRAVNRVREHDVEVLGSQSSESLR
jgi:hypothetical protein